MKFVLALIFCTQTAFAAITPQEKREALGKTQEVLRQILGPEGKLIGAVVTDEIGTRLLVQLSVTEEENGSRLCSYSYDRVLKRVLPDSWSCDF